MTLNVIQGALNILYFVKLFNLYKISISLYNHFALYLHYVIISVQTHVFEIASSLKVYIKFKSRHYY